MTSEPTPRIEGFELGPYATKTYLVRTDGRTGCWIIDPSFEPDPVIERVRALGLTPLAIVLTHAHVDHIAGIPDVLAEFPGIPVWLHEAEREWLGDAEQNLSAFGGFPVSMAGPDRLLKDGESLTLEGTNWEVRHTPGHSPGSISLVHAPSGVAISGDALFAGSIGRTDFPGCDFDTLARSIRTRLYTLPDETTLYPGHGPTSTVGRERKTNPFVRGSAK